MRWLAGWFLCVLVFACGGPAHAQSTTPPNCPTTGFTYVYLQADCSISRVHTASSQSSMMVPPSSPVTSYLCQANGNGGAPVQRLPYPSYSEGFPGCSAPGVSACSSGKSETVWPVVGTAPTSSSTATPTWSSGFNGSGQTSYVADQNGCEVAVKDPDNFVPSSAGGGCVVSETPNASGTYDVSCAYSGTQDGGASLQGDPDSGSGGNDPVGASDAAGAGGASDPTYIPGSPGGGSGSGTGTGTGTGTTPASGADGGSGTGTGTGTGTGAGTGTGTGGSGTGTGNCTGADAGSVGCAQFGSAASGAVGVSGVSISLSPVSVGGPSNPVCPLPVTFSMFGVSYALSYDPLCRLAQGVAPVVIGLCALAAGLIVVAGIRS